MLDSATVPVRYAITAGEWLEISQPLDHVHPMAGFALLLSALGAHAGDDEPMPAHAEAVLPPNAIAQFEQLRALKLKQAVAFHAVHVVVLRVPEIVLVHCPAVKHEPPQQS